MPESATASTRARLLVIDGDVDLCSLVTKHLEPAGFEVHAMHDAALGIRRALAREHALVVLDATLPTSDGFEALRRIRTQSQVPVLLLTARGDEVERIVGLEMGADDCLSKPFNPRELVARIRAILRRTTSGTGSMAWVADGERIAVGDVEIDVGARVVRRGGEIVPLTGVEFSLLEILLRGAGSVVSREELCKEVLGRSLTPYDRSLDMHVSNLRKKMGDRNGDVERIRSVRGVGYFYAKTR